MKNTGSIIRTAYCIWGPGKCLWYHPKRAEMVLFKKAPCTRSLRSYHQVYVRG